MNPNFLDFEQPIAELEAKIQELRHASHGQAFKQHRGEYLKPDTFMPSDIPLLQRIGQIPLRMFDGAGYLYCLVWRSAQG